MVNYDYIDLDNIIYHTPKKTNGKYISKVLYNNKKISIKTQYLKCINKINISENRCYVEFELDTTDKNLYDFFSDLDDVNMLTAYENSKEWFGENFPLDIIDEYYKRFIRYNSKLYKLYIKIKIPYNKTSGILLENFNSEDFKHNNLLSLNISYNGLCFMQQQFSSEWVLDSYEVEKNYIFQENIENIENDVYNDIKNNEINIELQNDSQETDSQETVSQEPDLEETDSQELDLEENKMDSEELELEEPDLEENKTEENKTDSEENKIEENVLDGDELRENNLGENKIEESGLNEDEIKENKLGENKLKNKKKNKNYKICE